MRDRSPYLLGLDGRTVRIRSRYPPYGTLWMLDAPGGADERFETDVRYAARFHDISHADVTTVLRACRKLPAAAPPPDRGGWVEAPPDADPVRDIAEMQAAIEEEPEFTGPEP